jgi:hypothetical protein
MPAPQAGNLVASVLGINAIYAASRIQHPFIRNVLLR